MSDPKGTQFVRIENRATGRTKRLPLAQAAGLIQSDTNNSGDSNWRFSGAGVVRAFDPRKGERAVPVTAADILDMKGQFGNPYVEEAAEFRAESLKRGDRRRLREAKKGEATLGTAVAIGLGAGATAGLSTKAAQLLSGDDGAEELEILNEEQGGVMLTAEIVGMIAPTLVSGGATLAAEGLAVTGAKVAASEVGAATLARTSGSVFAKASTAAGASRTAKALTRVGKSVAESVRFNAAHAADTNSELTMESVATYAAGDLLLGGALSAGRKVLSGGVKAAESAAAATAKHAVRSRQAVITKGFENLVNESRAEVEALRAAASKAEGGVSAAEGKALTEAQKSLRQLEELQEVITRNPEMAKHLTVGEGRLGELLEAQFKGRAKGAAWRMTKSAVTGMMGGKAGGLAGFAVGGPMGGLVGTVGGIIGKRLVGGVAKAIRSRVPAAMLVRANQALMTNTALAARSIAGTLASGDLTDSVFSAESEFDGRDMIVQLHGQMEHLNSNPEAMIGQLEMASAPVVDLGDEMVRSAQDAHMRQIQAIAEILPKRKNYTFSGVDERDLYSDAEVSTFKRKLKAVHDPGSVLLDAARGQLDSEAVAVVRKLYPQTYADFQYQLAAEMDQAKQNGKVYSPEQQHVISAMLNNQVNDVHSTKSRLIMASVTAQLQQSQAAQQGQRRPRVLNIGGQETALGRVSKL